MNFADVEREVARLRQDLSAGRLNEEQFKTQLREMMVEDTAGDWWMVGYETGEWYRHDGNDWVRADPPGRVVSQPVPQPISQTSTSVKPKSRRFKGNVVFVLGLIVTGVAGLQAGQLAFDLLFDHNNTMTWIFASVVWISGLVATVTITRKVWQGK